MVYSNTDFTKEIDILKNSLDKADPPQVWPMTTPTPSTP
jgi:hypothetical protein